MATNTLIFGTENYVSGNEPGNTIDNSALTFSATTGNFNTLSTNTPTYPSTFNAQYIGALNAPDTTNGQFNEFSDATKGADIRTVLDNFTLPYTFDLQSTPLENIIFSLRTVGGTAPYNGTINIWNSTNAGALVLWGSLAVANLENSQWVISGLTTSNPTVAQYDYNGNQVFAGNWDPLSTPNTSLPQDFVIELVDGEQTVDYVPLQAVNNCIPGDALLTKMVEKEE